MGGRIGLESAVGLGSTFWVELDLDKQPERPGAGLGELAQARVMLIGFPQAELEPLEQALTGWGATAVAVANIEEGAARLVAEISLAKPYHSGADLRVRRRAQAGAALPPRRPDPAPPSVLAVPRAAACSASKRCRRASARFWRCRSTSGSSSTCCTRCRRARRCAKAWCGCRITPARAPSRAGCTYWSRTTTRPTAK